MEKSRKSDNIENQLNLLEKLVRNGVINTYVPKSFLIKNGNSKNKKGVEKKRTLLHIYCKELHSNPGKIKIIKYLLEKKADPNITDEKGKTALETIIRWNFNNDVIIPALQLLKQYNAHFRPKLFEILGYATQPLADEFDKEDSELLSYILKQMDATALIADKNEQFIDYIKQTIEFGHKHQLKVLLKQVGQIHTILPELLDTIDVENKLYENISHYCKASESLSYIGTEQTSFLNFIPKKIYSKILLKVVNS